MQVLKEEMGRRLFAVMLRVAVKQAPSSILSNNSCAEGILSFFLVAASRNNDCDLVSLF